MKIIKPKKLLIILGLILAVSTGAIAETVYVSDNLRVGVRPEPDNAYAPVGVVRTGMKLEALDTQDGYTKIKTEDGLTGWIKDIYVVKKAPAVITLQSLQKKHDSLTVKAKEMQATITALESSNSSLNDQVDQLKEERSRLQLLQAKSISSQQKEKTTWLWWLITLVILVAAGFIGGIQWNRHQSMKRLGGLRL